jgi:septal ring factor EnvC (AmiA/AmiB activator)
LTALRKEKQEAKDESAALESSLSAVKKELADAKEEVNKTMERATKLGQDIIAQEAILADTRNKEIQVNLTIPKDTIMDDYLSVEELL